MKKLILAIFVSFFTTLFLSAFKVSPSAVKPQNELDYDTINFESTIISGVKLGDKQTSLHEKLGKPDSVRKEQTPDAQNGDSFEVYLYGRDAFFIMDNSLSGFEIKTNRFQLDNLAGLKVGDPIAKVKKQFPRSYKNRYLDEFNPSRITISVQFGQSNSFLEIYLEEGKVKSLTTVTDDDEEE